MPIGLELDMERGNLAQLKVVGVGGAGNNAVNSTAYAALSSFP